MIEYVAEISGCHGGSLTNAMMLIDEAYKSGATSIKFQIFEPEALAKKRGHSPDYADTLRKTHTPKDWFPKLIQHVGGTGLPWFASVFSKEDADFAEDMKCERYKISAFEADDVELMSYVRSFCKPMVVSINQDRCDMQAIKTVVEATSGVPIIPMFATNYGVDPIDAKLWLFKQWPEWIHERGLSDHTKGYLASLIAATMGVVMIERHIKLPHISTPDDMFAFVPAQFSGMVNLCNKIQQAMRDGST